MESRKQRLFIAVLWTVTTVMWSVISVFRLNDRYVGEGLKILSVLALLATIAACTANWYRFCKYNRDNDQ